MKTNQQTCAHSALPWSELDYMILCDKVNKYGNFYVADINHQFIDKADAEALAEARANLKLIVASVNHAAQLAEALRKLLHDHAHGNGLQAQHDRREQAKRILAAYEAAQ